MSAWEALCECGCGERPRANKRFIQGHHARVLNPSARPLGDRLWEKVEVTGFCWVWTGHTDGGYGRIRVEDKVLQAHRVAYELMIGDIPPGFEVDHLCRNRACVNPDHLEPVTRNENIRRAFAHITHCPQGHVLAGENVYVRNGGRKCRACMAAATKQWGLVVSECQECGKAMHRRSLARHARNIHQGGRK